MPQSPIPTVLWRAAPHDDLLWADWGDDLSVYHRPSGQTHFLNASTAALLRQILRDPTDLETAGHSLLRTHPYEGPDDFWDHLARLLVRLEDLGLVDRIRA